MSISKNSVEVKSKNSSKFGTGAILGSYEPVRFEQDPNCASGCGGSSCLCVGQTTCIKPGKGCSTGCGSSSKIKIFA
ncbi:hypothetical protein KDN24_00660 [Bacillus sp. Bva_UNVM-123]|uniref:hypothetical protein n=1 Tax=Bacillus sp. Bva_UNVM-123 TaxID=2829798 RepID=UPI00391F5043